MTIPKIVNIKREYKWVENFNPKRVTYRGYNLSEFEGHDGELKIVDGDDDCSFLIFSHANGWMRYELKDLMIRVCYSDVEYGRLSLEEYNNL